MFLLAHLLATRGRVAKLRVKSRTLITVTDTHGTTTRKNTDNGKAHPVPYLSSA